jgi:hypothetical protein
MIKNIYTYWENPVGKTTPPYIEACFRSAKVLCEAIGATFQVFSQDSAKGFLATHKVIHGNYFKLTSPSHRADCLRVAVIALNGGLWIDADCLFIRNPQPFFNMIAENEVNGHDFFYTQWDDGRVLNGYFYATPESRAMTTWLDHINQVLYHMPQIRTWTMFGEQIITPLALYKFGKECFRFDRKYFVPINTDKIPFAFFEDIPYSAFDKTYTVAVNLNHSFFCNHRPEITTASIDDLSTRSDLLGDILSRRSA